MLRAALAAQPAGKKDPAIHTELVEFVMERLRALLVTGEVTTEMFEAIKATGVTTPLDFAQRTEALKSFVALPASGNLAAAHKRIRNILKQAGDVSSAIDAARFEHETERSLFAALSALNLEGDYSQQLTQLATLRDWQAAGKVRYLGITHYTASAYDELEAVMRAERFDFVLGVPGVMPGTPSHVSASTPPRCSAPARPR